MPKDFKKGFKGALDQLPHGEVKEAEKELMKLLNVNSKTSYWLYLKGRQIPSADKAQAVITFFEEKGITNVYE